MSEIEAPIRTGPTETDSGRPTVRSRRGRPVGDRDAQRTKLLRAGIKVIADEGYACASLRKVAKQAGHTTGAITYYFADKEEMVAAIIEFMFDGFDAMLETGDEVEDHRERLRRWIELNSNSEVWLASFQLLARARHEPAFARIYQERYAHYRERLGAIIRKQQAAGSIRDDISSDFLADHIGSIADGWMIMLPIETERFAPERVDALIDSVIQLLRPPRVAERAPRRAAG